MAIEQRTIFTVNGVDYTTLQSAEKAEAWGKISDMIDDNVNTPEGRMATREFIHKYADILAKLLESYL